MLKKVLKISIFKLFSALNIFIKKNNNIILLYSANGGINFNLLPLKNYLIKEGYSKNYKIYCGVNSKKFFNYEDDVIYLNKVQSFLLFFKAKYVFYTTGQIPIKPSVDQLVIQLHHGITFKNTGAKTKINNGDEHFFTFCVGSSELYKSIYSQSFNCFPCNVLVNSEPMTDLFFEKHIKQCKKEKIVIWTPTFRQSNYLGYSDSNYVQLLPLFKNNDYEELNSVLHKLNIKLLVKIHPAQDLSLYKNLVFSNLKIYSSSDFDKKYDNLYKKLCESDALVADYSSLTLQYLLLDKPICYVIPDLENYKNLRGFALNPPEDFMPGPKIINKEQFYRFLKDISNNVDSYVSQRNIVKSLVHKYSDGKSCKRLIEFCGLKK